MTVSVLVAFHEVTVSVFVSFHDVTVSCLVTNKIPEDGVSGITVNTSGASAALAGALVVTTGFVG